MVSPARFFSIVTSTGAVIMALEILSSRVLAPFFGNSVYVWGSIISVFLAALSVGYFWGGRLADRQPRLALLGRLLAIAAAFLVLLLVFGRQLAGAVAAATGYSPAGTLVATALLFGPPSVLLATVSPFAIRLATRDLAYLGDTAGKLFALSTAGSLFGTLACTFLLIPYLELRQIFGLLLLATAVTAGVALLGELRREKLAAVAATLAALAALTGFVGNPDSAGRDGDTLYTRLTAYQSWEVFERDGIRFLRGDRALQSSLRLEDLQPALNYQRWQPAALLLNPEIDSLLVLGMGAGASGRYLRQARPELSADYVDIDAAIPEIAERFFFFEPGPLARTHVIDARRFLTSTDNHWDYIYSDAYIGLAVPFHLTTVEFFHLVRQRLNPDGVLGINLAADLEAPFARAMFRTVADVFGDALAFTVRGSGNTLVLASTRAVLMPKEQMIERGRELDRKWTFDPPLAMLAASRLD
ncbi:MAG: spermidine synthase, partial [Thermoanaerobaculia bacterium]